MMMNDVNDDFSENDDDDSSNDEIPIETEWQRDWRLLKLELRRQIDSNDPSLLQLKISNTNITAYFPDNGDWGEFGASIGRNTFIEEINISIYQVDIRSFARGFALNRSIKSLTLNCGMRGFNGEMLGELVPFFIKNPVFKSLRVEDANPTCLRALASSVLRQFDTMTEFTLYDYEENIDDDWDINEQDEFIEECKCFPVAVCEIFDALAGHSSLTKLRLEQYLEDGMMEDDNQQWQYRQISRKGWKSLATLLHKSSSSLMVLELENTPMDNEGVLFWQGDYL